jgi:hypothetical protein
MKQMIIVDGQEPLDLQGLFDEVQHLEYGDYVIVHENTRFVIERKTIPDYWNSLKSGRLNEQLTGCDALLVHHTMSDNEYWNIDVQRLYDTINGVSKHHIVWHVFSLNHLEKSLRRYEEQIINGTFGEFRRVHVKRDLPTIVRILADFDGIGEEKARMLLREHGTLENIFEAAYGQHFTKGIGEKTLLNISNRLGELYKE